MTDSQHEPGDNPNLGTAEPAPPPFNPPGGQDNPTAGADLAFFGPATAGPAADSPWYGQPGQRYRPPPPYLPPSTGSGKTGLIVAGVLGLVVVLGIGVAIGIFLGGDDGGSAGASSTARQGSGPGTYSMNGITNACDLVDPTPLTKWSSTPKGAPNHRETRPSTHDSGSLKCDVGYTSSTGAEFSMNRAEMSVEAEFTDGTAPPFYDHWKHADTVTAGPGSVSGEVTGIGSQGYWHSEVTGNLVAEMAYVVCVQDGNVSVRVKIALTREKGSPTVSLDELDSIARPQVRRALDGLKEK
ncbi:hypothetical protein [Nocardia sp. NBC_01009]|uniref:hypothetical protein n=1 Tax=Nocardia sp. NBC_01009 TaxID=2975996 RepID=UPI00386B40CC|nr:hypothetical protein OHA42_23585 [Nocardia sp. NBC_01009]